MKGIKKDECLQLAPSKEVADLILTVLYRGFQRREILVSDLTSDEFTWKTEEAVVFVLRYRVSVTSKNYEFEDEARSFQGFATWRLVARIARGRISRWARENYSLLKVHANKVLPLNGRGTVMQCLVRCNR